MGIFSSIACSGFSYRKPSRRRSRAWLIIAEVIWMTRDEAR
jgi:hypothetical protein